jgi:nitrite reductase/ring-hydroxylating ferredoxin subunit
MLSRLLTRLINAQAGWATPLGNFNKRWLGALFRPMRWAKDFLNGRWLGHPLHAVLTDVPIGCFTLVLIFDVIDQRAAADVSLAFGLLAMLGAAVAGLADYTDTDDHPLMVATVHATVMVVSLLVLLLSLVLRLGDAPGASRTLPIALDFVGYLLITAGAYVGGEVAYTLGNMINRHGWRFTSGAKWQPLDVTEIPEGTPVRANAGLQTLVLVRSGETIHALQNQCAHAGGPLSNGRIVDGCIECPWHGSQFALATGYRRAGPTVYDQPCYEIRRTDAGGYEARRVTVGSGGSGKVAGSR